MPSDTTPSPTFDTLGLSAPILEALAAEGYHTPTSIQAQAIPPILAGRDVLGCAQTGTGKTAAFALPILHRLHTSPRDTSARGPVLPRALVLSPTRELATQIADSFKTYGEHTGVRGAVVYGGVSQGQQVRRIKSGVDIVVATPGRLMDLMEQGLMPLSGIELLVLDEADRMLDMGFINPIRHIASQITSERQTLLFSATMPKSIAALASSLLTNPVRISVAPSTTATPKITQSLYMVEQHDKVALLGRLLADEEVERAVVFMRTKHGAERLAVTLSRDGVSAEAIHGNKSQNQRQRALDSFRSGRSRVLVATDVAARGLDVDGVTHVFNFHLPNEPEAYVHRIGRTGRAGAAGIAISFCDREERGFLKAIERLIGSRLDTVAHSASPARAAERPTEPPVRADAAPAEGHTPRPHGSLPRKKAAARNGPNTAPKPGAKHANKTNANPNTKTNARGTAGPRRDTQDSAMPMPAHRGGAKPFRGTGAKAGRPGAGVRRPAR